MKTEALTNTLISVAIVAGVWLIAGLKVDLTKVDSVIGWATAGGLLIAMAPITTRTWKSLSGR